MISIYSPNPLIEYSCRNDQDPSFELLIWIPATCPLRKLPLCFLNKGIRLILPFPCVTFAIRVHWCRPIRKEEIASWDGGNSTWGGQVRVFGTVPVYVRVQERARGEGRVLAGMKPKRAKDSACHKEKMQMCKQEEAVIQLSAEQIDWRDDTNDEPEDQELEADYIFMEKIQEVTLDSANNSRLISDAKRLQKVHNSDDDYNVFTNERQHLEQPESVNDTYLMKQGAANRWVDRLPPGTVDSCDLLKKALIQRCCPSSRTSKQLEEIYNFKQEGDETENQEKGLIWDEKFEEWCINNPNTLTSRYTKDQENLNPRPKDYPFKDWLLTKENYRKVQWDNTYWWHDQKSKEAERRKLGINIEEYEPPIGHIETFEVKRYSYDTGQSFICVTKELMDALPMGRESGSRFKDMIRKKWILEEGSTNRHSICLESNLKTH
uniref:Uncharacterized protein n=1 Tax=Tanacetum cinerariifolium TaxID=118510 RepID=A0A6L2JU84_TANCI|nr:hypothetical protein [Tanacetum cinerariifolium]